MKNEVFVLTRPQDCSILGVYSKEEYAELHRNSTFCPDELEIHRHTIDEGLDELTTDDV